MIRFLHEYTERYEILQKQSYVKVDIYTPESKNSTDQKAAAFRYLNHPLAGIAVEFRFKSLVSVHSCQLIL